MANNLFPIRADRSYTNRVFDAMLDQEAHDEHVELLSLLEDEEDILDDYDYDLFYEEDYLYDDYGPGFLRT